MTVGKNIFGVNCPQGQNCQRPNFLMVFSLWPIICIVSLLLMKKSVEHGGKNPPSQWFCSTCAWENGRNSQVTVDGVPYCHAAVVCHRIILIPPHCSIVQY
jgi:hypothetical protein